MRSSGSCDDVPATGQHHAPASGGQGAVGQHVLGDLADRGAPAAGDVPQVVEGGDRVDVALGHQVADGALDHDAVVEGVLELAGELAGRVGLDRRGEGGGDDVGELGEGRDLGRVPVVRLLHVDVERADGDAADAYWRAEHGPD